MTPKEQGHKSYWSRSGIGSCPYEKDSKESKEWVDGFLMGLMEEACELADKYELFEIKGLDISQ